jgi:hypothetical protein
MHGCSQGFALEQKRFTDLAHGETVFLLTRCVTLDTRNMELEVRKLRIYGSFPAENLGYSEAGQCLRMLFIWPYNAHPGLLAQPDMYW